MCIKQSKVIGDNLRRWQQSQQPWRWVEAHQGIWNHDDWLRLLAELETSEFWPMVPAEVGRVLEEMKLCYWNLKRWKESGHPAWWVESRNGSWNHGEWQALVGLLQRSEYWPLLPAAVGELLEQLKVRHWNLQRWQEVGEARRWVEDHRGAWTHADWLDLLAELQQSHFWPVVPEALGRMLEQLKVQYWNLQRWQCSGEPRLWVETRGLGWSDAGRLELMNDLRMSDYWPLHPAMVSNLLEDLRAEVQSAWDLFDQEEPVWGNPELAEDFLFLRFPPTWELPALPSEPPEWDTSTGDPPVLPWGDRAA